VLPDRGQVEVIGRREVDVAAVLLCLADVPPHCAQLHVPWRRPGHTEVVAIFEDRPAARATPEAGAVFDGLALQLDLVPLADVREHAFKANAAPLLCVEG